MNNIGPGTKLMLTSASNGAAIIANPMPVEVWTKAAITTAQFAKKNASSA
ncbi:hypothetical protein [Roseibium sp.]